MPNRRDLHYDNDNVFLWHLDKHALNELTLMEQLTICCYYSSMLPVKLWLSSFIWALNQLHGDNMLASFQTRKVYSNIVWW